MSNEITNAYCNRCANSTKHVVLAVERQEDTEEKGSGFYDLYEMLKCLGCDDITLRHTSKWSEDKPTIFYYLPTIARRAPWWISRELTIRDLDSDAFVPTQIRGLMREVYTAIQNGLSRLAAMGIRAALDATMANKVGDHGNFTVTIDAFAAAGYLSVRQRDHIDSLLGAGNAAVHRGWEPTAADLIILLDIIESTIEVSYLHDEAANSLKRRVPPKPPTQKRKPV
jgi:hypothetical protein